MDLSQMDALFTQTIVGDYDADDAWGAVAALRSDGSQEIFDLAKAWCTSENPLKRARGAGILCQLRLAPTAPESLASPKWLYRNETFPLFLAMLEREEDPMVLASVIHGLGHLYTEESVPSILRYENHSDKDVRYAVACGLGSTPNEPQAVQGLLRLTGDVDSDVRDWAVFGLGVQGDADSEAIRTILLLCLEDEDQDVREEAASGLAKRCDERVLPKLREMLRNPKFSVRVAEAAEALLGETTVPKSGMETTIWSLYRNGSVLRNTTRPVVRALLQWRDAA